ncbi:SprT family zinc-dependent metalloprotease [Oscillatoria sp. CS-180]|uniref:M48 family metallopeptidase n=1 Tax=Oscillatoria sp. CS-180 TaxID=3021720 RepID=UPI002330A720|nr:SprT family zinc-dependent metalloprotease [Oscillatoria sp. CS-180]MDB9525532.1 SprT family zinc-dependent metalloprotease [Oscillatoria sp. CS-180]
MTENAQQLTLFPLSDHQAPLPNYKVRESNRARHVSLKVSFQGNLEVVVPQGFNPKEIPDILERRRGWITKTLKRIEKQRDALPEEHSVEKPTSLELRSRGEIWTVVYKKARGSTVALTQSSPQELTLRGKIDDSEDCRELLRSWLQRKARAELSPWLQDISQRCDLAYSRMTVRGQSTRWGSCSSSQSISLNYKLLFLPSHLVDYVLIHELCHTVHMNHSKAFWQLVKRYCPELDQVKSELKKGWQYVPSWVDA